MATAKLSPVLADFLIVHILISSLPLFALPNPHGRTAICLEAPDLLQCLTGVAYATLHSSIPASCVFPTYNNIVCILAFVSNPHRMEAYHPDRWRPESDMRSQNFWQQCDLLYMPKFNLLKPA
jgi:hypothetical protein